MSKIMRAMYAEARAAREMAASAERRQTERRDGHSSQPATSQGIDWWDKKRTCTTYAALNDVLFAALAVVKHPSSPMDHANWWARRRAEVF